MAADLNHTVSVGDGPIHYDVRKPFDVVIPVPTGASSADVNVRLTASVRHPEQSTYRKIGITASKLQATGLSAEDAESVLLDGRHILDRPHVVTVKDGSGTRLQSSRHRYGLFNRGGIVMPDTTSAWLDKDSDGQVDAGEWIDQQVATGYDAYGNLTEARDAHGTVTSTIMGYGRIRPVAAFTGAAAAQTAAVVFDDYADWADLDANAPRQLEQDGRAARRGSGRRRARREQRRSAQGSSQQRERRLRDRRHGGIRERADRRSARRRRQDRSRPHKVGVRRGRHVQGAQRHEPGRDRGLLRRQPVVPRENINGEARK